MCYLLLLGLILSGSRFLSDFCVKLRRIVAKTPSIGAFRPQLPQTCGDIHIGTGCILSS